MRDALVAVTLSLLLAVALTWPLAAQLDTAGRVDSGDGRHGVWNVAWVARALTTAPSTLFDANIFFPHTQTLAYSEANLVAGVLAIPAWTLSGGNPYAAYNSVALIAFALAALSAYFLARTVGASRFGAAVAALVYGYSPYMLAHLPHIQLLMTWGPAMSLAMMHRFIEVPSTGRALTLGLTLALTGLACAYYGIFSGLVVSGGLLWFAIRDGRWREPAFWVRGLLAAAVVAAIILPFFLPYLSVREAGFSRTLDDARLFSTSGRAYLASAMLLHTWMLPLIGTWREVLFPGFQPIILALIALALAARQSVGASRRIAGFYCAVIVLSFWISLGPDGGLYTVLYQTLPAFSFLRAPSRMGVLVTLGAAILSSLALTWLAGRAWKHRTALAALIAVIAVAESSAGPLALAPAPAVDRVYWWLAGMPRAPVAEFPFYQGPDERHRQTEYMLMSTFHWQPLLNGYSDYIPSDYFEAKQILQTFPSTEAIDVLNERRIRWVVVHFNRYPEDYRRRLRVMMRQWSTRLRTVIDDTEVSLYEVIWPMRPADPPLP